MLRAYASITIDGCFVVRGLKVVAGSKGLFVAMPSRRKPEGGYADLAHPIWRETRAALEAVILKAYFDDAPGFADSGVPAIMPIGPAPMRRGAAREIPPPEAGRPDAISRRMPPSAPSTPSL